jgi:hypothetical protein
MIVMLVVFSNWWIKINGMITMPLRRPGGSELANHPWDMDLETLKSLCFLMHFA